MAQESYSSCAVDAGRHDDPSSSCLGTCLYGFVDGLLVGGCERGVDTDAVVTDRGFCPIGGYGEGAVGKMELSDVLFDDLVLVVPSVGKCCQGEEEREDVKK